MSRVLVTSFLVLSLLCSCSSRGVQGDPAAIMLGAQVGGMLGGLVGDPHGKNYTGHMLGSIVGTLTGAAVGNVLTSPQNSECGNEWEEEYVNTRNTDTKDYSMFPSKLAVRKIRFVDDNRNQIIDSGETCQIIFIVMNRGSAPVYNVTPVVEEVSGLKHIYISPSVSVESILPGEGIKYTANISAGRKLKTSEAIFRIYALEGRGASSIVKEFVLPTQRLRR